MVALREKENEKSVNIGIIVRKKICCGCGACNVACSSGAIEMVFGEKYNFPKINISRCKDCSRCLQVCPSSWLLNRKPDFKINKLPIDAKYLIAFSNSSFIRRMSASGGFVTGMIVYLLKTGQIDGAIVTTTDTINPLINRPKIARNEEEVLESMGSRYGPVSICSAILEVVSKRNGSYALVGKPCDIEAVKRLTKYYPIIANRIKLYIGLFCHQTPNRKATLSFLQEKGIRLENGNIIRYRGEGWPGSFRVHDKKRVIFKCDHEEAWKNIGGEINIRCRLCIDHFAFYADLSVGDPGLRLAAGEEEGISIVIMRNMGKTMCMIRDAAQKGYIAYRQISRNSVLEDKGPLVSKSENYQALLFIYRALFQKKIELGAFRIRGFGAKLRYFKKEQRKDYYC